MATAHYGLTIDNFTKVNNTWEYLEEILLEYQLKEQIIVLEKVYEISERGSKHLHMHVLMRPNVYKQRLRKRGLSTHIDLLPTAHDVRCWVLYIYKAIPPYERCIEFLEQHNLIMRLNQNRILL